MEWWIIVKKLNIVEWETKYSYSANRLIEESHKAWIKLKFFTPEQFDIIVTKDDRKSIRVDGEVLPLPDFVIPRMWAWTTYFALAVIRHLERLWVFVVNTSESIEIVKDKLFTLQVLAENNLPVPKTMLAKFPVNVDLVEKQIGFPAVIKTLSWSQWSWVYLSENRESFNNLMSMIDNISKSSTNLIFQEFIKSSKGKDLRVIVIWGKVVACMQRIWKEGEFRANYHLWWTVEKFELTPEIEWIATQSAQILWLDIAWIDLLFDSDHFKICEANSSPWLKWIESCTWLNIAWEIFNFIKVRLWKF